jgi:L-alanine-DL-glutamate epimerase-like enolase superfamily enzyme
MTNWPTLAELPLRIESYALDRLSQAFAYGTERVTTRVRLQGGGEEGLGEDVSVIPGGDEDNTLHVMGPVLPLAGEWTLGGFCEHLAGVEQWQEAPQWEPMRLWRNWAFESAALDLALRQAGAPLHEVLGREPRPVRFVNSLGLGDPPTFEPIARRLEHHPALRFKVDAVPAWSADLVEQVAATGAVEIVDFKGRYGMEVEDEDALVAMYQRVVAAFPDALLEDGHELPGAVALLAPEEGRISYDAPIHAKEDIDALPLAPRAVNIKPCRVGDLRTLFDLYDYVDARGLIAYGGGMGELDVGRGQIQLLASLFHPDGPNDTAPSGYNHDTPAADLPASPLDPQPAPTGFRRA